MRRVDSGELRVGSVLRIGCDRVNYGSTLVWNNL